MSEREPSVKFFYNGSAVVLGGSLTKPEPEDIDAPNPATLSPSGGSSEFRVDNYHFREIVSFASARAKVVGNFDALTDTYNTLSTVTITGFDVLGMISADAVVARIAFSHSPEGSRVSIAGSHFVNLRIAGEPVSVELIPEAPKGQLDALMQAGAAKRRSLFCGTEMNGRHIDQFGTIHLGEFLPDEHHPRLTMVRIEFGCPVEGEMSLGAVQGGGRPWP